MFSVIRIGAYLVSSISIWQFFQGDVGGMNHYSVYNHLALDPGHGQILGVCAGFSKFTGIDVTFIRLIWFILVFYRGLGIALYILAFLIMPTAG